MKFMVYCEGKNGPSVVHDNYNKAADEAKRICERENRVVKILQIVAEAHPTITATIVDAETSMPQKESPLVMRVGRNSAIF